MKEFTIVRIKTEIHNKLIKYCEDNCGARIDLTLSSIVNQFLEEGEKK